uniref:Centrosomal protein 250 n=1 Tax=Zosterops lateralis melanops TaxID=1220523 RepID=A0A8D2P4M1_ZOSLA
MLTGVKETLSFDLTFPFFLKGSLPGRWEATADHSLEKALFQVEEEQQSCENLAEVNTLLREHLDKASEVNSALKEDIGKLTVDWMRAREELELKEREWCSERELYDSYLRGEHNRLLSLWREVVTFRRHFREMKTATDRDLSELKAEQARLSGSILVNCTRLNSCVQLRESIPQGKPVLKDQAEQQMEPKINQTGQEVIALQVRWDMEKKELQDRVMELSALLVQSQKQNEEKEKTMKTLNDTVEILVCFTFTWEIAYTVFYCFSLLDAHPLSTAFVFRGAVSASCFFQLSGATFPAPYCSFVHLPCPFLQALREELSARQESNNFLLQQQRHQEEKCREVQQRLEELEETCKKSSSHQQHLQSLVETLRSDCANLEKTREELQEHLRLMEQEASHLRQSNAELQMKEESAQAEKAKQQDRMARACHEQELLVKDLATLEEKHSLLQSELVVKRQTLEKLQLQKDLLEQEKDEIAMALEKAERSVAELTGAQNKLNAERADLQAAAAKMSSINEALALDKVQLNKYVWQVSKVARDVATCLSPAAAASQPSYLANKELCAEKARLEQLLKEAEEQREELWLELRTLGEEKAETREKFHQQESTRRALEQLHQEFSGQGHTLAQVCREKELLGQEKAALEGQLADMEQHQHDLSKQLAETRSAKESLESSLFAAQQQISHLEITRNHLEGQVLTVTQTKEVIEGENLVCFVSSGAALSLRLCVSMFQIHTLQDAVVQMETTQLAREKQLLQELEESRAGERCLKDSVQVLETEMSELRVRLQSSENRAETLATQCQQASGAHQETQSQLDKLLLILHYMIRDSRDVHEWDRLQADKEKLEYEIKLLEESVTASETRANAAIDKNYSLEQELQSALSMLKIKNEEVQNQGKKMEILQKEAGETKALQEHLTHVTAILSEREGEMKLYQEQMRMLEKQKEMHKTALNQIIKDITEKEQKTESQQEQIQELEKQQEKQRIVLSKMSQELEEKDQEIRSQQELIRELEKQLELQNSAVSRVSKELEERHLEIKFQEEKIMILEQHGAVQVRNLLLDLDDMKGNLKEKRLELLSLTQQIQELEKEREDVKSLNASLEHLQTVLKDRESECDTQREELRLLQQHKEQQDGNLQQLLEVMKMQLKTVHRLMDIQKQQTRSYEEKMEEQMNVLHRDLEYSRTILKENDLMIESQKELIETFQKQKQDSEQQKQILQHLQVELKEKEQEILSLRKPCEACKEKEEKHEAEQRNFHATTLTLKEKEERICVLEDTITKLQQQKEETAVQTKAILQKLEDAESSLETRDQEIVSLQEHVQDLQEQKEVAGKQAKSLEQDLDKASQMLQKNHLEFLKQTEQMNAFQLREESMKVALTSCQKQVTLLEEVMRKKDEDSDALRQRLQHVEEELKTLQNLQFRLTEKNEEVRHFGEQEFLKEAFPEKGEIKAQSEQKQLEEETRALRKDLQHVQQTLTKKDKEIKYQTDRVKYLKKTLIEREQELRRQSELLKELTLALRWKDEGETLKKQIQKLRKWEEDEVEKRKILQERDHFLQRQKEITQQLEAEREVNGEELEHVAAALKQRESREHEWRENTRVLNAALSKSEIANGNLKKEITILQRMLSERDTDQFHQQRVCCFGLWTRRRTRTLALSIPAVITLPDVLILTPFNIYVASAHGISSLDAQQAVAEGEQLSWLSEKRLMLQSLECLQRAVAKLENERVELKQQNTELKRTLEQVNWAFAASVEPQAPLEHNMSAQAVSVPTAGSVGLRMLLPVWACLSWALCLFQVSLLQSQLAQDRQHRQNYIESCARTSQELSHLHQELSCSFAAVLKEPKAAVLEAETRKLDQSLSLNSALTSLDRQSLERQPKHPRARPARINDDLR